MSAWRLMQGLCEKCDIKKIMYFVSRAFLAAGLLSVTFTESNAKGFLGDVWGVVTDPLKLKRSSDTLADSVDRSLIQLQQLEGVVNYDTKERLEQIRSILKDAMQGGDAIIKRATSSALEIEGKINDDAVRLIYNAKCAVDVTLKNTAQEAMAGLLNQVSKARPAVKFLGVTIVNYSSKEVKIDNPNDAYASAKSNIISVLNENLESHSPASRIFFAYQNLQAAAKYALCYYIVNNGPAGQKIWVQEINELERLMVPWTVVLIPDINYANGGR